LVSAFSTEIVRRQTMIVILLKMLDFME